MKVFAVGITVRLPFTHAEQSVSLKLTNKKKNNKERYSPQSHRLVCSVDDFFRAPVLRTTGTDQLFFDRYYTVSHAAEIGAGAGRSWPWRRKRLLIRIQPPTLEQEHEPFRSRPSRRESSMSLLSSLRCVYVQVSKLIAPLLLPDKLGFGSFIGIASCRCIAVEVSFACVARIFICTGASMRRRRRIGRIRGICGQVASM